jgi:hypothetical protein
VNEAKVRGREFGGQVKWGESCHFPSALIQTTVLFFIVFISDTNLANQLNSGHHVI